VLFLPKGIVGIPGMVSDWLKKRNKRGEPDETSQPKPGEEPA
jgi:urea transport system permease protein